MPRARLVSHRAGDDEDDPIADEPSSSEDEDGYNDAAASGEEATEDEAVEDEQDGGGNVASTAARAGSTLRANAAVAPQQAANGAGTGSNKQRKLTISLSSKNDVCKVCGQRGHRAGFVGATYLDCPNKPCYLCKQLGHTTTTCPYRILPGHGCTAAATAGGGGGGRRGGLMSSLQGRECSGSRHPPPVSVASTVPHYQVDAAILKLHTRRCCTLEFHPRRDNIVVSGDKKGAIAVWDFDKVHERTVYDTVHSCLANAVRFLPWLDDMAAVTASSDGTAKFLDLETGVWRPLLDLNPGGWVQGGPWHMVYGCDASPALHTVVVGDSNGSVHLLDPRTRGAVSSLQLHRRGNKVVSVHLHPLHPSLVLTAGNDHSARIFDIRELSSGLRPPPPAEPTAAAARSPAAAAAAAGSAVAAALSPSPPRAAEKPAAGCGSGKGGGKRGGAAAATCSAEVAVMHHPRVVNAAYFSPHSGRRILTTCQDNRVRVWDYAPWGCGGPADREIVHSHDFNRYLTPFKAEWDPKDPTESVFVIGRYISEDFGGTALHPVDILSAADGSLLRQLTDANLTTISPVNKPHPRRDLIVSGSSRSLYLWAPVRDDDVMEDEQEKLREAGRAAAAAGPGAGAKGTAGGASKGGASGGAGAAGAARASRYFVSFDADPGGGGGKKRKKGAPPGKAPPGADDDDDD